MSTPPAIYTIAPYAAAIDKRISAIVVRLEMRCDDARRDDIEMTPRIHDITDADGKHLDLGGRRLDGLAARAWDVVEARTIAADRGETYQVFVGTALVAKLEAWEA